MPGELFGVDRDREVFGVLLAGPVSARTVVHADLVENDVARVQPLQYGFDDQRVQQPEHCRVETVAADQQGVDGEQPWHAAGAGIAAGQPAQVGELSVQMQRVRLEFVQQPEDPAPVARHHGREAQIEIDRQAGLRHRERGYPDDPVTVLLRYFWRALIGGRDHEDVVARGRVSLGQRGRHMRAAADSRREEIVDDGDTHQR